MKIIIRAVLIACAMLAAPLTAAADPLTYDSLKAMVASLGFTPKDIGTASPKMEILVVSADFNVPLGLEITPSGRYVWASANLGASKINGDGALQLLKRSKDWQPTQFWITSSNLLMIGIALSNTTITPDMLKTALDKVAGDIRASSDIWDPPPTQ